MNTPDPDNLISFFRTTYWLISRQADGITHEQSVMQLPFRANCMNWVMGYLVTEWDFVLTLLGEAFLWAESEYLLYRTHSDPITQNSGSLRFEKIMQYLATSQERILAALTRITPEQLACPASSNGDEGPVGELIAGFHWHETYHCGQVEILRQLAGKDDKVV